MPVCSGRMTIKEVSMANVQEALAKGKSIYVGIDVHKKDWVVSILCQGEELYHSAITPDSSNGGVP